MDVQSLALGFGFGGVAGSLLANFMNMPHLATPLFFLCGIVGAVLCGSEGINPMEELFGGF